MKKTTGDIIILHMCTINDNHMMSDFWDMEHNRQNFLSFWTVFCPITLLTTQKIKILKKWKKKKKSWDLTLRCNFCFHFGLFFAPAPKQLKKSNFIKNFKKCLEMLSFNTWTKNYDNMMYNSWDIVHIGWMDRQMNGWKKWHTEVCAAPKKMDPHLSVNLFWTTDFSSCSNALNTIFFFF